MASKLTHEKTAAVMLAAGLTPLEQYQNSKQPWMCECQSCKAIVTPAFSSVQSGQGGCRSCAIREQAAKRKMSDQEASIVMLENGFQPLEPYPGSQKKWRCTCTTCGNEVMVLRNTVATNGTGTATGTSAVTAAIAPIAPSSPTTLIATAGDGSASIAFTAGSAGGVARPAQQGGCAGSFKIHASY